MLPACSEEDGHDCLLNLQAAVLCQHWVRWVCQLTDTLAAAAQPMLHDDHLASCPRSTCGRLKLLLATLMPEAFAA